MRHYFLIVALEAIFCGTVSGQNFYNGNQKNGWNSPSNIPVQNQNRNPVQQNYPTSNFQNQPRNGNGIQQNFGQNTDFGSQQSSGNSNQNFQNIGPSTNNNFQGTQPNNIQQMQPNNMQQFPITNPNKGISGDNTWLNQQQSPFVQQPPIRAQYGNPQENNPSQIGSFPNVQSPLQTVNNGNYPQGNSYPFAPNNGMAQQQAPILPNTGYNGDSALKNQQQQSSFPQQPDQAQDVNWQGNYRSQPGFNANSQQQQPFQRVPNKYPQGGSQNQYLQQPPGSSPVRRRRRRKKKVNRTSSATPIPQVESFNQDMQIGNESPIIESEQVPPGIPNDYPGFSYPPDFFEDLMKGLGAFMPPTDYGNPPINHGVADSGGPNASKQTGLSNDVSQQMENEPIETKSPIIVNDQIPPDIPNDYPGFSYPPDFFQDMLKGLFDYPTQTSTQADVDSLEQNVNNGDQNQTGWNSPQNISAQNQNRNPVQQNYFTHNFQSEQHGPPKLKLRQRFQDQNANTQNGSPSVQQGSQQDEGATATQDIGPSKLQLTDKSEVQKDYIKDGPPSKKKEAEDSGEPKKLLHKHFQVENKKIPDSSSLLQQKDSGPQKKLLPEPFDRSD